MDAEIELARLRARNKQLAEDKAYLQLIIRLIEQLNPLDDLEPMIDGMLASIIETIGGANIRLWYWIGDELRYVDVLGAGHAPATLDDPLALLAVKRGELVEEMRDAAENLLRNDLIDGAWTWAFPLCTGATPIGVIKLENLFIRSGHLRDYLAVFFNHVALILSNRIQQLLRQRAEEKLRLIASVFTHAREGIVITDAEANMIEVNDAFTRITGYSRAEALGENPRMLKSGRQLPEFYEALWQSLINHGHWTGEIWNRRKSGQVYVEMLTISAVRDDAGTTRHYVGLFTDITPLKEHEQALEYSAHYDALTELPNRGLLTDRLQQAMAQSRRHDRPLSVVYIDLDGFKAVNDTHGHHIGDELLIAVAQRMKAALREGDTLARIGGDEFVAVLADMDHGYDCEPVLIRLLQAAADPVLIQGKRLRVSASLGVTSYPEDSVDAHELVDHADQAMYLAKQAGKNRFHRFAPRSNC